MQYYIEMKLMEDAYGSGFSSGLTLAGSRSTKDLICVQETEDRRIFENQKGHQVSLLLKKLSATKSQNDNGQGVIELQTVFDNRSKETACLELLSSFAIQGVKADRIYRMQSFWSAEGRLRVDRTEELQLEPSWNRCGIRVEKFGNLGSMPVRKWFPFLALEDSKTGTFIGIQLYCPSSWQMELICREDETLTVTGGIADRDFGHWKKLIRPGETFTAPKAVLAFGSSLYEVCDQLVKAQNPAVSTQDACCDIMFNEYCTTWGNPSLANIRKIADTLKGKQVKYLIIDSGWYGGNEGWWASVGDWEVNTDKFPGGLKPAADYIRSCGMIPGLWYEFESVGEKSRYYNQEEHLLKKDGVVITVGEKRFWDMADPWVTDYLLQKVIKVLKDCGFGYLKVDYNETIGIGCDGTESLGEGLRQRIQASQSFFRKIREEIPDIVIENCSSGGHRLEPSMMELASQASFSDAHELMIIPVIAANLHRVIKPSQSQIWAVIRAKDNEARINYSIINTFLGRMCLSGDIYDLSEKQWNRIEDGCSFYKAVSEIIEKGTTTRIENQIESYNRPQGWQLVIRELGNRKLVIAHRFEASSPVPDDFLVDSEVVREYGDCSGDFTAKAWLLKKIK